MEHAIGDLLDILALFGGIALVIRASAKAKLEHRKLDMMHGQISSASSAHASVDSSARHLPPSAGREDAVLTELRALKQQISDMQSTGHEFDLAFDAALERMEGRVARLEARAAVPAVAPVDAPNILRNGQG